MLLSSNAALLESSTVSRRDALTARVLHLFRHTSNKSANVQIYRAPTISIFDAIANNVQVLLNPVDPIPDPLLPNAIEPTELPDQVSSHSSFILLKQHLTQVIFHPNNISPKQHNISPKQLT
jgi:hypothetical protein